MKKWLHLTLFNGASIVVDAYSITAVLPQVKNKPEKGCQLYFGAPDGDYFQVKQTMDYVVALLP